MIADIIWSFFCSIGSVDSGDAVVPDLDSGDAVVPVVRWWKVCDVGNSNVQTSTTALS
jgi:hypothetical protein